MRKVVCDKCGEDIRGDNEVRFVEITKLSEEKKLVPIMQTLEVCPSCCEKIRNKMAEV